MSIAETLAARMHHRLGGVIGADELLDLAQPVLLEAVRSYDPAVSPFGPYMVMKLKWAMLDEARKLHRRERAAARLMACAALERLADADEKSGPDESELTAGPTTESEDQASLSKFLAQRAAAIALGFAAEPGAARPAADEETPEEQLSRAQLGAVLRRAVEVLPERQRALVERHYFDGESFDAIALDLGLSKSWASRLHAQAMKLLAEALAPVV